MIYDKRNRDNLAKLADNTKVAAMKFYNYCIANRVEILIYETIRTLEQQKQNVANGVSQTLRSYHLVGQALDFVPVDANGKALWNGYGALEVQKAIKYAKSIGFEWGGDWKSFVDKPHLQYNYKGYGTDTFGKITVNTAANEEELTMSQYKELLAKIERLENEIATKVNATSNNKVSATHKAGYDWAVSKGLTDGSNPGGALIREQLFTVLNRYDALEQPILNETGRKEAREMIRRGVEEGLFTGDHKNIDNYSDVELLSYAIAYANRKTK